MRELSLFSGVGGGVLASKLLGHEMVGYVEKSPFCLQILKQRIDDGHIDAAPIFEDIDEFILSGAARQYRDVAQMVSAGFPCQPFSVSGKQEHETDARNCWPQTYATVCEVRPEYVFFENVTGLLTSGYFDTVMSDLASARYDAKWLVLGADDCGANHHRKRLWILGQKQEQPRQTAHFKGCGSFHSHRVNVGTQRHRPQEIPKFKALSRWQNVGGVEDMRKRSDIPEPLFWRVGNGVSRRMDRTKALGNAQVPIVASRAFEILMNS